MLIQFEEYLTHENLYLWINFGIIPFWLMLIFIPNSRITQIFINSIILPLLLSSAYVYLIYETISSDQSIIDIFDLYLSLDNYNTYQEPLGQWNDALKLFYTDMKKHSFNLQNIISYI